MNTFRLLAMLLSAIAVAGIGAIYVWSTVNHLLAGRVEWPHVFGSLVAIVAMLGLLRLTVQGIRQMEEPR